MQKMTALAAALLLLLAGGCSKDSGTGTNPFGGGGPGGGGGGVTFTITSGQGQQGIVFRGAPSTAVTVTQIIAALPAAGYADTIAGDGTTVFQAGTAYDIGEYTGVAQGQAWRFSFQGRLGNAQGTQYNVSSNYTVP
ncbi:MAG: hypothetical protein WB626_07640 [Bacteroidota bacterium]